MYVPGLCSMQTLSVAAQLDRLRPTAERSGWPCILRRKWQLSLGTACRDVENGSIVPSKPNTTIAPIRVQTRTAANPARTDRSRLGLFGSADDDAFCIPPWPLGSWLLSNTDTDPPAGTINQSINQSIWTNLAMKETCHIRCKFYKNLKIHIFYSSRATFLT